MRIGLLFTTICVSAGLVSFGCRTPDEISEAKDTQVRPYEGELGMQPGKGYETVFEDARGMCVEFDSIDSSGNAQQVVYELDLVESHRELAASLNVSSASQIKAAVPDTNVNVSAKTRFSLGYSYNMNKYSVYVLAKVEVRNETSNLMNPRIKQSIQDQLANGDADAVDRLRLRCGDSYMSAFTTGGEFFGVLEIQTSSEEQQLEIKREVETAVAADGIGEASSSNSFESKLKRIAKDRNLKVYTYQRGGQGQAQTGLVDTAESLIQRIKEFPEFVTRQSGTAANYSATFQDYFTLDLNLPLEYRNQLLNAQDIIQELAGHQTTTVDIRGDIDYIIDHPNSFVNVTPDVVARLRTDKRALVEHTRKIYTAAKMCQRNFRECKVPDDISNYQFPELPKRKTTIQQLTRDVIAVKTKLQNVDVDRLYDGLFNPPDCFVEVRAVAPGGRYKRIRRTPSDFTNPRCNDLDHEFLLPLSMLREAYRGLGTTEAEGRIEVMVRDDDVGTDEDTIGTLTKNYSQITSDNAVIDTLTGDYITMTVEMEVR